MRRLPFALGGVSIHVPLAEHDAPSGRSPRCGRRFQFTCPSRSTTTARQLSTPPLRFQFTCPSRSTTVEAVSRERLPDVSIHVPLAEHDLIGVDYLPAVNRFNSRAPRGARRTGRTHGSGSGSFNSRAPRGARPRYGAGAAASRRFQFTCPSRSTTFWQMPARVSGEVSIHVPLAEHDVVLVLLDLHLVMFQFTCPSRSTTSPVIGIYCITAFQFTCPSRSTTSLKQESRIGFRVSIHVPLAEHDQNF